MEMANSYIKMLLLPTRGTCNCLQNRVGFLFYFFFGGGGGGTSKEREKRLTEKAHEK